MASRQGRARDGAETANGRIELSRQKDESLVGEPAEVFRFPAFTHDAGSGVGGGIAQEMAEFMGGGMAEQVGERPMGGGGQLADAFGIDAGVRAGAFLENGHAGGAGGGGVAAGDELEHEAARTRRESARRGQGRPGGRAAQGHVRADAGLQENSRGLIHRFPKSPGGQGGEVVDGDGQGGLRRQGRGQRNELNESSDGAPHAPRLDPAGRYGQPPAITFASYGGTRRSRGNHLKTKGLCIAIKGC